MSTVRRRESPAWSRPHLSSFPTGCPRSPGRTISLLKREDLQTVRSYKLRGAYNLLVQLSDQEVAAGVVCSSAGNHAQGFAYAVACSVFAAASTYRPRRRSRSATASATTAGSSSS